MSARQQTKYTFLKRIHIPANVYARAFVNMYVQNGLVEYNIKSNLSVGLKDKHFCKDFTRPANKRKFSNCIDKFMKHEYTRYIVFALLFIV